MQDRFARTPRAPFYAVIFSSQRKDVDPEGYRAASIRMLELAEKVPGYLGMESTRDPEGFGITVSYWEPDSPHHASKVASL